MENPALETGLIGGIEQRTIQIVASDPNWPARFDAQKRTIRTASGNAALEVEHIGSTAVPQLAAKDIIDVLLVVADSGDESAYLNPLVEAGYQLRVREPEFDEHRMFRTPDRDVHIHVYSRGSVEIERYLNFRNWLRQHPDDRQAYERLKIQLASRDWKDMNAYAATKGTFIEEVIVKARG